MSNLQKELLVELISNWDLEQLTTYLVELRIRREDMDKWIKDVESIRRKKTKKQTAENGPRDGR